MRQCQPLLGGPRAEIAQGTHDLLPGPLGRVDRLDQHVIGIDLVFIAACALAEEHSHYMNLFARKRQAQVTRFSHYHGLFACPDPRKTREKRDLVHSPEGKNAPVMKWTVEVGLATRALRPHGGLSGKRARHHAATGASRCASGGLLQVGLDAAAARSSSAGRPTLPSWAVITAFPSSGSLCRPAFCMVMLSGWMPSSPNSDGSNIACGPCLYWSRYLPFRVAGWGENAPSTTGTRSGGGI